LQTYEVFINLLFNGAVCSLNNTMPKDEMNENIIGSCV